MWIVYQWRAQVSALGLYKENDYCYLLLVLEVDRGTGVLLEGERRLDLNL